VLDWTDHRDVAKGDIMSRAILAALTVCALVLAGAAWGAPAKFSNGIVVKVGEKRSFTRTELRPGAIVKCTYRGHSLSLAAPARLQVGGGVAWPGAQAQGFYLNVIGKPGGAYAVTCGLGGSVLVI
jgi:hypothetical protein